MKLSTQSSTIEESTRSPKSLPPEASDAFGALEKLGSVYAAELSELGNETAVETSFATELNALALGLKTSSPSEQAAAIRSFRNGFAELCDSAQFVQLLEEVFISAAGASLRKDPKVARVLATSATHIAESLEESGRQEQAVALLWNCNNIVGHNSKFLGAEPVRVSNGYLAMNQALQRMALDLGREVVRVHPIGSYNASYIASQAADNIDQHLRERTAASIPWARTREFTSTALTGDSRIRKYVDVATGQYRPIDELPELKAGILPRRHNE